MEQAAIYDNPLCTLKYTKLFINNRNIYIYIYTLNSIIRYSIKNIRYYYIISNEMTKIKIFNREGKQEIISLIKHKLEYFTNVWDGLIDT